MSEEVSLRVDHFAATVCGEQTLQRIADKYNVTISDLRSHNPQLQDVNVGEILPRGSTVHLPPMLRQWWKAAGAYFCLGEMNSRLEDLQLRKARCIAWYSEGISDSPTSQDVGPDGSGSRDGRGASTHSDVGQLPQRNVLSKSERLVALCAEEASRQVGDVVALSERAGVKKQVREVPYLTDPKRIVEAATELEEEFHGDRSMPLVSLQRDNARLFSSPTEDPIEVNVVTKATAQTVPDVSDDFCVLHSHQWEFTFLRPNSVVVTEVWAVLPCQALTALIDAFECKVELLPYPQTKNRFLFIGGAFYIDDRHRDAPEGGAAGSSEAERGKFCDLSEPIRGVSEAEAGNAPLGFGKCPVRSASKTTFADVNVRLWELCVYRHLGYCDHSFYLSAVKPLPGADAAISRNAGEGGATAVAEATATSRAPQPRQGLRSLYPHRPVKMNGLITKCRMCAFKPATIVVYGDEMCPQNPTILCQSCHYVLHADENGNVPESDSYVKVELPPGVRF